MEKTRKTTAKKIVVYALVLAVLLALVIIPFTLKEPDAAAGASILSAAVERGELNSTVSFSGALEAQTASDVSLPEGVKLTGYLAANGESVKEGQDVATVDRVSVMESIVTVQENLTYLTEQMNDTDTGEVVSTITAPAAGRVKAIYIERGRSASQATRDNGALVVLSLDGKMAAALETDAVKAGEAVTVTLSDGTTEDGTVERVLDGRTTVTMSDEKAALNEKVTVSTADGTVLGTGELYIHSRWNAVYTDGTVGAVSVKENQTVFAGQALFTLENVRSSAEFETLAAQRREYEETMMKLFRMYQSGTAVAPCDGVVSGTNKELIEKVTSAGEMPAAQLLANAPGDAPDAAFTNRVGRITGTGESLSLSLYDGTQPVSDYKAEIAANSAFYAALPMTVPQSLSMGELAAVPVYALTGQEWQSIGASALQTEDTVLLAYNDGGTLVWIVRIASGGNVPGGNTDGTDWSREMGGMAAAAAPQTFEMYSLEETVIASVTPQDTVSMTVTVDEMDILALSVGLKGQVTLSALPGQSFEGIVTEIDAAGTNSGGNSKYTAVITMVRQDNMLSGMNASVVLVTGTHEDVLLLPAEAVSEEGSRTVVYTALDKEGKPTSPKEVETGVSDGISVEILAGLEEGESVWYAYYDTSTAESVLKGLAAQKGSEA